MTDLERFFKENKSIIAGNNYDIFDSSSCRELRPKRVGNAKASCEAQIGSRTNPEEKIKLEYYCPERKEGTTAKDY
jgi:hypothetical protein